MRYVPWIGPQTELGVPGLCFCVSITLDAPRRLTPRCFCSESRRPIYSLTNSFCFNSNLKLVNKPRRQDKLTIGLPNKQRSNHRFGTPEWRYLKNSANSVSRCPKTKCENWNRWIADKSLMQLRRLLKVGEKRKKQKRKMKAKIWRLEKKISKFGYP